MYTEDSGETTTCCDQVDLHHLFKKKIQTRKREYFKYFRLCTSLHFIPVNCSSLHFIALYCTLLHFIPVNCSSLHFIALYCTLLHFIALYCTLLHFIALYCTLSRRCIWFLLFESNVYVYNSTIFKLAKSSYLFYILFSLNRKAGGGHKTKQSLLILW